MPLPIGLIAGGAAIVASLALAGIQTVRMDNAKAAEAETKLECANFKTGIAEQNLTLT